VVSRHERRPHSDKPACKRPTGETSHHAVTKNTIATRTVRRGKNALTLRGLCRDVHPQLLHKPRCSCGEPKPKAAARASPVAAAKTHIRLSVCLYLTPDHRTQVRCLFGCSNREVHEVVRAGVTPTLAQPDRQFLHEACQSGTPYTATDSVLPSSCILLGEHVAVP
jgi:hypothetical protein